jgi:hypothetical protein
VERSYLLLAYSFSLFSLCFAPSDRWSWERSATGTAQQSQLARGEMSGGIDEKEVIGQMRGGLVFVKTKDRPIIVKFYQDNMDMKVWLEQPDITVLSHGNMLIGFHQQPGDEVLVPSTPGIMYTFVYPSRSEVDAMYARFRDTTADGPPRENATYQIYQFFAADPEGRKLELPASHIYE